jgi:hypothetical protein
MADDPRRRHLSTLAGREDPQAGEGPVIGRPPQELCFAMSWFGPKPSAKKLFGQYVSASDVERLIHEGNKAPQREVRLLSFVMIAVAGETADDTAARCGEVLDAVAANGWFVASVFGPILLAVSGTPFDREPSVQAGELARQLQGLFGETVKSRHGQRDALFGDLGSATRRTLSAQLPDQLALVAQLHSQAWGSAEVD